VGGYLRPQARVEEIGTIKSNQLPTQPCGRVCFFLIQQKLNELLAASVCDNFVQKMQKHSISQISLQKLAN
jgi:hypothetical protein